MKITKLFTIPIVDGEVSQRIDESLKAMPPRGGMVPMRQWLSVGHMLAELGHGINETLLDLDRHQQWQSLSTPEKARLLIQLLERTQWRDPVTKPQAPPEKKPEAPPVNNHPVTPIETIPSPPTENESAVDLTPLATESEDDEDHDYANFMR